MKDGLRYCTYCRRNQNAETFLEVKDRRTGRLINYKCEKCALKQLIPADQRDAKAENIRKEQRAVKRQMLRQLKNKFLLKDED